MYKLHVYRKMKTVYSQAIVYKCQNFFQVVVHVIITDQCNQIKH